MNQSALREMSPVCWISPSTCAKTIEDDDRTITAQMFGKTLHEDGLTHSAGRMDDEGIAWLASKDSNVIKNGTVDNLANRRKCVLRWI
jgi:hypothetical protein